MRSALTGLVASLSCVAACGTAPAAAVAPAVDLGGDLAMVPDWPKAMPIVGSPTGGPCTQNSDCAGSSGFPGSPQCRTSFTANLPDGPLVAPMPGGFCTSPCKPLPKDSVHGTSAMCPGEDAICVPFGVNGLCWTPCLQARDCRDGYVCANVFGGVDFPACVPAGSSECDPPDDPRPFGKSCPMGQACITFSDDNSFGACSAVCDPILQTCRDSGGAAQNCVVDLHSADGSGFCQTPMKVKEGSVCQFTGSCDIGMVCFQSHCRWMCRKGGAPGGKFGGLCPMQQTCLDFWAPDWQVRFGADKVGVCEP